MKVFGNSTAPGMYSQPMSLLTDLYQLTMAYGYWKVGTMQKESVFHLYFRKSPFQGGYTIACGLAQVIEFIENFGFHDSDIAYLATLQGNDSRPLFEKGFLQYLRDMQFECDVDAVPEGTVVFPHEPMIRVQGPIVQCQIIETALLNLINFPTLVATKAARICSAAEGQPVLEFGLRRAQGLDGALTASRAAYVGGCSATSNVLAGKMFGIPVRGTLAHSWIMAFPSEREAFQSYANVLPNNCIFLVDTYDTLEGVKKAVEVGRWLHQHGHEFSGVRLDSGDLAYLSVEARKILDEGGFPETKIVASNDLDETIIESLKTQNAAIDMWGVGTKLVTAYDQPALNGVYKLGALRSHGQPWEYKIKISEQAVKVTTPGIHQIRRYSTPQENIADVIHDVDTDLSKGCVMVDPFDMTRQRHFSNRMTYKEILVPIFRKGQRVYTSPPLPQIQAYAQNELRRFHPGIRRFVNPHQYPVGMEKSLYDLKTLLTLKAREEPHA